ncbi:MAG: crossover junction endodeoxyribonuclease RuvC [Chlamydiae bacterium]|nr:crossover junction endodeoxyribonuclease RuvC [Chlamydiota bacterium]
MKKIILGFDPGTEKTGWALLTQIQGKIHLIEAGFIAIASKNSLQKRLGELLREATKILEKFSPDQIAIESQFVGLNPRATMAIAMSRGVILAAADQKNIEAFEYSPAEAKRGITGKGNATKEEVQKMCRLLFQRPFETPFDTTDAIALAYCHLNRIKTGIV